MTESKLENQLASRRLPQLLCSLPRSVLPHHLIPLFLVSSLQVTLHSSCLHINMYTAYEERKYILFVLLCFLSLGDLT